MNKLTLGSLFDGSGGFPLGGLLCGIEPLWASEVEPFPIRVTTKRLPQMKHLGDINKIDGAKIPPVDIITGGFCCQDLSVAGKRAGLHGERSGLFFQIIRIIKEMRSATDNAYPKFAVLENVPGMYSSSKGLDFLEVLNEIVKIKQEGLVPDETLSVPMPENGKWSTSGEIVGNSFSIGWRTLDAQFWGVAQRRRRCFIVVDFNGERAGQVLFDESRLSGNPPQGGIPWQGATGDTSVGFGSTGFDGYNFAVSGDVTATLGINCGLSTGRNGVMCLNDQGGGFMGVSEDTSGTLRAQEHGHPPIVFEPGAASRVGGHVWENFTGALRADAGDNQLAVAIENHPADSRVKISEDGIVQTLDARMGMGGGNVPLVMNERQYALTVGEDVANTLTGTDFKGTQCVFEPKAYGICSKNSNSMKSANPHSGIYEAETSRTLDTSIPDPNKNAGGMAVVAVQGSIIGRKPENGPQGSGVSEDISFSLTSADRHAVCYQDKIGSLCASDYKFPQQQQIEENKAIVEQLTFGNNGFGRWDEQPATLKANGGDYPGGENVVVEKTVASFYSQMKAESICYNENAEANTLVNGTSPGFHNGIVISDENRYVVRRLTPTECALLQGFPPDWCENLETPEASEADIAWWSEVFETHRKIMGKSKKPKSRKQIIKWLENPHSDSAEYKMWGNGVALPCVRFVLGGIVWVIDKS